jgi:uncharacterized protein
VPRGRPGAGLRPPRNGFLLPHATWDHPPARPRASDTGYARWLIAIFDRWLAGGELMGRPRQFWPAAS